MVSRYIPELQSLCAKLLATNCRSMSQKQRYNFFRNIPFHIKELIKAYPVNIIEWYKDEHLLNIEILQHYIRNKKDVHYIVNGYISDCNKGITRKRVIWRKCQNIYCENSVLQKITQSPDEMYWGLCEACEQFRIPHYKLMNLHRTIEANLIL